MAVTDVDTRRHRSFRAMTKTRGTGDQSGSFEALVTTYGSPYEVGYGWAEQIQRGAFAAATGSPLPVMYQHDWDSGPIGSGVVTDSARGIVVSGSLYLAESERARTCYRAMQDGSISCWSIGFKPTAINDDPNVPYLETIVEGDLIEASVVLRGANPGAVTIDVRNRSAGRPRRQPTSRERRRLEDLRRRYGGKPWFEELLRDQKIAR
jgi:HK97 family phage prohead protease